MKLKTLMLAMFAGSALSSGAIADGQYMINKVKSDIYSSLNLNSLHALGEVGLSVPPDYIDLDGKHSIPVDQLVYDHEEILRSLEEARDSSLRAYTINQTTGLVASVETVVAYSSLDSNTITITASGLVEDGGYFSPTLRPVNEFTHPKDGVLKFVFEAKSYNDRSTLAFTSISATGTFDLPRGIHSVKVISLKNELQTLILPTIELSLE